jgi:ribosomal protein S18 acetylase RimI-like enzyme
MKVTYFGRKNDYSVDQDTLRTCTELTEVATACFNQQVTPETFMEYLRDDYSFIALQGVLRSSGEKKIVGFAAFQMTEDSGIRLVSFGVHPDFQNNGLGRQMLKMFVEKAETQRRDIRTRIFEKDSAARKILLSLGFKIVRSKRVRHEKSLSKCYYLQYRSSARFMDSLNACFRIKHKTVHPDMLEFVKQILNAE